MLVLGPWPWSSRPKIQVLGLGIEVLGLESGIWPRP